jgi:hypothetical protein
LHCAVSIGGDDGHLADDAADAVQQPVGGVANVLGVRIEGGQRGHRADQHAHGVGIVAEAFHELLDVLEEPMCCAGRPASSVQLLGVGQARR